MSDMLSCWSTCVHFAAFEKAIAALTDALKQNGPALIHVPVSSVHPWSGGEAFGWWDVPIPGYMEERRKAYEHAITEETV